MINGIGVDIVDINRIKLKDSFINKILSCDEISIYNTLATDKRKKEFLAGRFASKEAIFKADNSVGCPFNEISVLNDINGKPYSNIDGVMISISHEKDYAIAYVISIKKEV